MEKRIKVLYEIFSTFDISKIFAVDYFKKIFLDVIVDWYAYKYDQVYILQRVHQILLNQVIIVWTKYYLKCRMAENQQRRNDRIIKDKNVW